MLHVLPKDTIPNDAITPPGAQTPLAGAAIPSHTPSPGELDTSKPVSVLLKQGTAEAHSQAENSEGAALLARGKLAKREYIRFLFMLWHVYDELERGLFEHREHPVIFHIYNPRVFSRATYISFDICHLLETVTWQTDPFYADFIDHFPPAVKEYVDRLAYIGRPEASEADVSLLAAHAYVRYLGDLSGGQIMRRKIVKAYDLYDDGDGIWFYNFRTLERATGDRPADPSELKKIKEWFKNGLDEAVTDAETKIALVQEASAAFIYNTALFKALDAIPAPPPVQSKFPSLFATHVTQEIENADKPSGVASKTFPLGAVIAFILAASLAHFTLVVGGFTGTNGANKAAGLLDWLRSKGFLLGSSS